MEVNLVQSECDLSQIWKSVQFFSVARINSCTYLPTLLTVQLFDFVYHTTPVIVFSLTLWCQISGPNKKVSIQPDI